MTRSIKDKDSISDNTKPLASEIDKVIHEPARLLIVSYLFLLESADFIYLKNETGLTWGNLSTHMRKLEDAGYVEIKKTFVLKKPHTMASLTEKGIIAFEDYKQKMNGILN